MQLLRVAILRRISLNQNEKREPFAKKQKRLNHPVEPNRHPRSCSPGPAEDPPPQPPAQSAPANRARTRCRQNPPATSAASAEASANSDAASCTPPQPLWGPLSTQTAQAEERKSARHRPGDRKNAPKPASSADGTPRSRSCAATPHTPRLPQAPTESPAACDRNAPNAEHPHSDDNPSSEPATPRGLSDLEQKIPNLANLARLWQHHSASKVFDNIRGSPLKPLLASCLRGTLVNPSNCATEK